MGLVQLFLGNSTKAIMKRHEVLIPFSQFHRSCLFLALIAKVNAPEVKGYPTDIDGKIHYAIDFYNGPLTDHFDQEEVLWNYVKVKSDKLSQIIEELEAERRGIVELFQVLIANSSESTLNQIGNLLESHVRKEERVLFQQIQSDLTEEELFKISKLTA